MEAKHEFKDVEFVHGDSLLREVWAAGLRSIFQYNPEEWQLDVTLTRKFIPGFYRQYYGGEVSGSGKKNVRYFDSADDVPMLSVNREWRRVIVTEATD